MATNPLRNTLKQAISVDLNTTGKAFSSKLTPEIRDNLFRIKLGDRSSLETTLGALRRGTNFDIELYALKKPRRSVLKSIGDTIFSQLTRREIRQNLKLLGKSTRPGTQEEALTQIVEPGEYVLRVFQRRGQGRYRAEFRTQPTSLQPIPSGSAFTFNWLKQIGSSKNDYAYGVTVRNDEISIAGTTETGLAGLPTAGLNEAFIARYNQNGDRQLTIQSSTTAADTIFDIITDSAGNYYVAGARVKFTGSLPSESDGFVAKFSADGTKLWDKKIDSDNISVPLIGSRDRFDVASSIGLDANGNVFVAGFLKAFPNVLGVSSDSTAFVSKFNNTNGDLITSFGSGGTAEFGASGSSAAADLAVDSSGNLYISGITGATLTASDPNAPFTGGDAFVTKVNGTSGDALWNQTLASTGDAQDYGRSIAVSNGSVYVAGQTNGALPGQTNAGGTDGFVAKLGATGGALQWVNQFGTSTLDEAQAIAVDAAGHLYVTGETNAALFGGTYYGGSDAFIAKYDAAGARLASTQLGTAQNDEAYNITVDAAGNIFVVGQTLGSLAGANSSQGGYDAWVAKYRVV
jgi:Beta-propeller repeat